MNEPLNQHLHSVSLKRKMNNSPLCAGQNRSASDAAPSVC